MSKKEKQINASLNVKNSYDFEGNASTERTNEKAKSALAVFKHRLAIPIEYKFSNEHCDVLMNYAKSVHLNIEWYTSSKKRQMRDVKLYTVCSLALLLIIPLIVFIVGFSIGENGTDVTAETIFAMITGFITAILAFQQAVGTVLRGQIRIKEFWEALSNLKQLLYTFQDRWKNNVVDIKIRDVKSADAKTNIEAQKEYILNITFIDELKADIIKAKGIEQKEQDNFFSNYTVQDVNVTNLIASAKSNAVTLIDKLQSAELAQKFANEKKAIEEKNAVEKNALQVKQDEGLSKLKTELRIKELKETIVKQEQIVEMYKARIDELAYETTDEAKASLLIARAKYHAAYDARLTAMAEVISLEPSGEIQ